MPSPPYNHVENNNDQHSLYERLEDYTCARCGGHVSHQIPVYNTDNCSCADLAGGPGSAHPFLERQSYSHTNEAMLVHQPASYTSEKSGQEGIENRAPDLQNSKTWERKLEEPDLKETNQYHHANPPFAIQRWVGCPEEHYYHAPAYDTMHAPCGCLKQTFHMEAPSTWKRNTNSKPSTRSTLNGDWLGSSWTWKIDPVTGVGGWMDVEGNGFEVGDGIYPYDTALNDVLQ